MGFIFFQQVVASERKFKKKKKLGNYPYLSVVFSITLALFVVGLFGLLMQHSNRLSQLIRENVEIQIYLNKFITENDKLRIQKTLSGKKYAADVKLVTKEEAAQQFVEETGEDFLNFLGENPLHDAFVLRIVPEYYQSDSLRIIRSEIESLAGVFEVAYLESLVDAINQNLTKIGMVLVGFATLLLLTVAILINNTIKLALFSQRFLIRSMQLVGANRGFIQKPFLLRSATHGIVGGIIASGLLFGVLNYAYQSITELELLQDVRQQFYLFGGLVIFGALIGFISSLRAVNKYLKMSLDELY